MHASAKVAHQNAQVQTQPSRGPAPAIGAAIIAGHGFHRGEDLFRQFVDRGLEVFVQ